MRGEGFWYGGARISMRRLFCFIIGVGILGVAGAIVIECFKHPSLILLSAAGIGVPIL